MDFLFLSANVLIKNTEKRLSEKRDDNFHFKFDILNTFYFGFTQKR